MQKITVTDGNAGVRAAKVGIALRDGAHPKLVIRAWKEAGECAREGDCAVSRRTANCDADKILFSNEAFYKLFWLHFLKQVKVNT